MSNQWGSAGDDGGGAQSGGGGAAPGSGQQQDDGSEQAYVNIIQAAMSAAENAGGGVLSPPANSELSATYEKRSSMSGSDSVSSSVGMTSPGMSDRPLAVPTTGSSPQPEPHYYGMLKDDGDDQDKPTTSPSGRSFGRRQNGEGGYARRRHIKPAKRSGSLGTVEFSSVVEEQLSNTGQMSGAASVDGGLPQVPNIEDPFGGPPAGTEIDVVKRRHSTGVLEYNDSDLDDYDILDLAPIADALSGRSCHSTTPSPGPGEGATASTSAPPQASPRRAQRRPSGDLITKKSSKTVKKKGTKMKRRGSGNSVSSLDGAIADIDDSGKKSRGWKKPKDKPKRPLSAYNLFFKHERAKIVNTVTDDDDKNSMPVEILSSDAAPASDDPNKKRRHRAAHGKIGFAALARTVAARWKELPPDERAVFEARAAIEKTRYRGEMEAWNKTQKEKRLTEQRQQLKEYQEERMRHELLAQKQQLEAQQQMLLMQQQRQEEAANQRQQQQQQAQQQPQPGMGGVYSQFGNNTNDPMQLLLAMQQQMSMTNSSNMGNPQALNAVGGSNSNPSAGVGGSATHAMNVHQQSQQNSFGELGGNMPTMNTGMSGTSGVLNTMPRDGQQQQLPTQEELRAQQTAKLRQIQQAQQILQMQAQTIQRQQQLQDQALQQEHGGGSAHDTSNSGNGSGSGSGSGSSNRAPPDNPEFYANMFNTLQAQSAINSSSNNSAMLQQMQQMMHNSFNSLASQQQQHHQQHGGGSSGATGTTTDATTGAEHMEMSADLTQPMAITENVFDEVATNEEMLRMLGSGLGLDYSGGVNSGADDGEGDAQVREMMNQFDLGNLDPLGFNFGTGGSER